MAMMMSEEDKLVAAVEILAQVLVEQNKWPVKLARVAAGTFASMQAKCPEEFKRYAKMSKQEQRDLFSYYSTGFNQGWAYAKLETN